MHHNFSEYTLVNFINSYTQGLLERTLRSNNLQCNETQKLRNEKNHNNAELHSQIHVLELTTKTFLDTILDPSKVSYVMQSHLNAIAIIIFMYKVYILF